jgi:hypothetical protein
MELAKHNRVQLIWVPGHEGIAGNVTADQLAKIGAEYPFIEPEPACGISIGVAKNAIRDWTISSSDWLPLSWSSMIWDAWGGPWNTHIFAGAIRSVIAPLNGFPKRRHAVCRSPVFPGKEGH